MLCRVCAFRQHRGAKNLEMHFIHYSSGAGELFHHPHRSDVRHAELFQGKRPFGAHPDGTQIYVRTRHEEISLIRAQGSQGIGNFCIKGGRKS